MHLTGKHVNYYHIYHRKLWLFDQGLSFQHDHANVQDGALLHLSAYPQRARRFREVQLEGIKIDFYDPVDRVVHEIKRSNKLEASSVAQLQYYLRVLERHGVPEPTGLLEYPTMRRVHPVTLTTEVRAAIDAWEAGIAEVTGPVPPWSSTSPSASSAATTTSATPANKGDESCRWLTATQF